MVRQPNNQKIREGGQFAGDFESVTTETVDASEITTETVDASEITTDNLSLGDITGDGLPAQAIEHGKAWADDGQLYSTVDTAVSNATALVIVGPGTFNETVSGFSDNMALRGCGRSTVIDGGTSGPAISVNANDVLIENIAVKTTEGQGNNYDGIIGSGGKSGLTTHKIWVLESDRFGISANGDASRVISVQANSSAIDASAVRLAGNNSIADDILGSVTDSGNGNTVGETA